MNELVQHAGQTASRAKLFYYRVSPCTVSDEELTGNALKIYLQILASRKPVGVRELARALDLPVSTVHYHLKKLEEEDLVRRSSDGYVISRTVVPPGYVLLAGRPFKRLAVYGAFFTGFSLGEVYLCLATGVTLERAALAAVTALAAALFLIESRAAR